MILKTIFSNKTVLYKFIISVMQPLTADNEQNTVYFTNKLYKNKYTVKKFKVINKKKYKNKKYTEKQSFYSNNSIII